jgi:hypothetical protein
MIKCLKCREIIQGCTDKTYRELYDRTGLIGNICTACFDKEPENETRVSGELIDNFKLESCWICKKDLGYYYLTDSFVGITIICVSCYTGVKSDPDYESKIYKSRINHKKQ